MNQCHLDEIKGLHIELTNICTLKCPGCSRTQFINQWPQHWKNHSLDINDIFNFIDIDLSGKRILLCGNYGDPIYHPNFIDIVARFKKQGARLEIVTNGSYKTPSWWAELTSYLDELDILTFSIDGTPENFTEYRINADWESILVGIKIAVNSKCIVEWKYIPFNYNQNNIDEIKTLSQELCVDRFLLEPSNRFHNDTEYLRPTQELVDKTFQLQNHWKNNTVEVDPLCYKGTQHFITAEGYYSPCCMITDFRFYYKTPFGKNKKQYDIKTSTLSKILERTEVDNFYQKLSLETVCQYNCPKVSAN